MFSLEEVERAAIHWYGSTSIDACCLAENRIMRGEIPT